jgi:hypothetical protein
MALKMINPRIMKIRIIYLFIVKMKRRSRKRIDVFIDMKRPPFLFVFL